MSDQVSQLDPAAPRPVSAWRQWELAALALLVLAVYFTRLSAVPICGEESRWANAAREMIASGDWIVPRQQGTLFAERPPLSSWAMALVGLTRGQIDLVAVRLPSALATLLLTCGIYLYVRGWASRLAAFASAAIFATFGQVMMLGRFGESEALFTLFAGGSLLVWHAGYLRGRPMALVWTAGYALAALGALTKGLQAPVYFMAATATFLAVRREWRTLFSRAHAAGLLGFAAIVGAWLVPFLPQGPDALIDVWTGLLEERVSMAGLVAHLASYPFETFACLLPWSPLLIGLVKSSIRRSLWQARPQVQFLLVALAVSYPTVWLVTGARGRYYMPLYPCLAVLMGLIVERCTVAGVYRPDFAMWQRYLRGLAVATAIGAACVLTITLVPADAWAAARQPLPFACAWIAAALITAGVALWALRSESAPRPQVAIAVGALFAGLSYSGLVVNARIAGGNDLAPAVASVKEQLPGADDLVSLGRVYHRFAYSYQTPIRQVSWPTTAEQLPADVEYFCFDRRPGDTAEDRAGNDDRLGAHTPGVLPFAWEKIAEIPCDPVKRGVPHRSVIIGRVRRPAEAAGGLSVSRPGRR
ncbi:MAG: ArnT family glycosyltransferase [Pirellulales bacterium]